MTLETAVKLVKDAGKQVLTDSLVQGMARSMSLNTMKCMLMSQACIVASATLNSDAKERGLLDMAAASFMSVAIKDAMNIVCAVKDLKPMVGPMGDRTSMAHRLEELVALPPATPKEITPEDIMTRVQMMYNQDLEEQSIFGCPSFIFFNAQGSNLSEKQKKAEKLRQVTGVDGKPYYVQHMRSEFKTSTDQAVPVPVRPNLRPFAERVSEPFIVKICGKKHTIDAQAMHNKITSKMPLFNAQGGTMTDPEQLADDADTTTTTTPVHQKPVEPVASDTFPKFAKRVSGGRYACPRCGKECKQNKISTYKPNASVESDALAEARLWAGSALCGACRDKLIRLVNSGGVDAETGTPIRMDKPDAAPAKTASDEAQYNNLKAQEEQLTKELDKIAEEYVVTSSELEAQQKKLKLEATALALMGEDASEADKKSLETVRFNVQQTKFKVESLDQKNQKLLSTRSEVVSKRMHVVAGAPVGSKPAAKSRSTSFDTSLGDKLSNVTVRPGNKRKS